MINYKESKSKKIIFGVGGGRGMGLRVGAGVSVFVLL